MNSMFNLGLSFLLSLSFLSSFPITNHKENCQKDSIIYYLTMDDKSPVMNDYSIAKITYNKESTSNVIVDSFVPDKQFLYTYYRHLNNNKPYNNLGICGYTAISMFLSFFDTYWNDLIIEEKYESNVTNINSNSLYKNYYYESPGVYNNLSYSSPSMNSLINELKNLGYTDSNSIEYKKELDKLIMREINSQIKEGTFLGKLFSIGLNNGSIIPHSTLDSYNSNSDNYLNGIGVNYTIMNNILTDYVNTNSFLSNEVNIVTGKNNYDRSSDLQNYEIDRNRIRNNIIQLLKEGKPVIIGGQGFDDKNNNNAQDINESTWGHVAIAYEYDEANDIIYGNLGWSSSYNHANFDNQFNLGITDYWTFNFKNNSQNMTNHYYFNDYNASYSPYRKKVFNELKPEEYEFEQSYNFAEIASEITIPNSLNKNTIQFKRLRTGFIENQYINLSPRRIGAGIAYLEYSLSQPIVELDVNLSFWSKKEFTNSYNSEYLIQYYDDEWKTALNLWDDISLSTSRLSPTSLKFIFPFKITKFRFYSSSIYESDRNKGRLSIFEMRLCYE